jgi:hypothetical protein
MRSRAIRISIRSCAGGAESDYSRAIWRRYHRGARGCRETFGAQRPRSAVRDRLRADVNSSGAVRAARRRPTEPFPSKSGAQSRSKSSTICISSAKPSSRPGPLPPQPALSWWIPSGTTRSKTNHGRYEEARARSGNDQIRHRQPRPRRSRGGPQNSCRRSSVRAARCQRRIGTHSTAGTRRGNRNTTW